MAATPGWGTAHMHMQAFAKFIRTFPNRLKSMEGHEHALPHLEYLLHRLDTNWQGYCRSHAAIANMMQMLDHDVVQLDEDFDREIADLGLEYEASRAGIKQMMTIQVEPVAALPPRPSEVKIPSFSGNYLEYTAFRSAVLARVNNQTYPPHAKIDIVINALTGDAKTHIGQVRGQDEQEYQRIWRCLEDTYHNPYLLQRSHMGAIYEQPSIRAESAAAYRAMASRISQNLHALKQLNIPTEQLDPAILEMVLRKLDEKGTQYWETTRPKNELPTVASFLSFLEERIIVLQNTAIQAARQDMKSEAHEQRNDSRNNRSGRSNGNSYHDSRKRPAEGHGGGDAKRYRAEGDQGAQNGGDGRPKAPMTCLMECQYKRPHHLWLCNKFKAMDLDGRVAFVKKHNLCRRCVTIPHKIDSCKSPKCNDCQDDVHNKVLCPKYMVIAKANHARAKKDGHSGRNAFAKKE